MPKWGLTMTEGTVAVAQARRARNSRRPANSRHGNQQDRQRGRGARRRHLASRRWPRPATLPVGALLGVVAPETSPTPRSTSCIRVVETPPTGRMAERDGPPRESRSRASACGMRAGEGDNDRALHPRLRRRSQQLDVQPAHRGATGGRARPAGARRVGQKCPASATRNPVARSCSAGCARHRRAHLVGHSMGGAWRAPRGCAPERVASVTLVAAAGSAREINTAFIDGFVEMGAAARRRRRSTYWSTTRLWSAARWSRKSCATSASTASPRRCRRSRRAWFARRPASPT